MDINETWNQLSEYTSKLEPYFDQASIISSRYQQIAVNKVIEHWPNAQNLNRFQIFLLLNASIIGLFILLRVVSALNPFNVYRQIVKFSFNLPFVANKVKQQLAKEKAKFIQSYPKKFRSQLKRIPYNPVDADFGDESQKNSIKGFLSGSRYSDKKNSDFNIELATLFSYSNPLHFDLHPHLKQMEVEVIKMSAKMLNFFSDKNQNNPKNEKGKNQREAIGGFFSGGTQSILMAILASRQYGFKYKGVTNPNLVICSTGHAAGLKAASMFGLEVRIVKTDKNQQMDISDTKSKIDSNTICVYTSYPNYPYGTVDPIEQIARICKKRDIPVHLDMCLGGFVVPFLKKSDGSPYFVVPDGVTTISLDCHKYGLSAKGGSILLFKSEKLRRMELFVTSQWPGGLYGTIGIAGSRSGTTIASAWISMVRQGTKGYTKNAESVSKAVKTLATLLKQNGFKVFGNPEICCIGFNHPKYPVSVIKECFKKRGWDIPVIQKPMALHYSFTPINSVKIDQMVADVKEIIPELQKLKDDAKYHKGSELELYGACSKIPDTAAKGLVMKMILDAFVEI